MSRRTLLALLPVLAAVQTGSAQQPAMPQAPAIGYAANILSPEVSANGTVTFRFAAPKATAVSVICECLTLEEAAKVEQELAQLGQRSATDPDMVRLTKALANIRANQGERALTKGANGVWSLTLNGVAPDWYEYHFKVDDFEMLDPRNPVPKYNSRPNLIESLLQVSGPTPMVWELKPVPHGTVSERYYDSKATGTTRRVFIYTPPNYEHTTAKLPVLYLLHGGDGDETLWTQYGRANLILDNEIAEKKSVPMIIVMPSAYAYPWYVGAAPEKQRADFEKDLLTDLIPFVEGNYRVAADRDHRAMAGLSMGGGLTLAIGPRHLDVFSRIGMFSAGAGNDPATSLKDLVANSKNVNSQLKVWWMGIGTEDPGYQAAKKSSDYMNSVGIKHSFQTLPGAHTWIMWRHFLSSFAPTLWGTPSSPTN
jgi:enterochelin esterase-like enzyme